MEKQQRTIGSILLGILLWYFIIAGVVTVVAFTYFNFFHCTGYFNLCGHAGINIVLALITGLAWPIIIPVIVWGYL